MPGRPEGQRQSTMLALLAAAAAVAALLLGWQGTAGLLEAPQLLATCPNVRWEPYSTNLETVLSTRLKSASIAEGMRLAINREPRLPLATYEEIYDGKWPVLITDVVKHWNASHWDRDSFTDAYSSGIFFTKLSANGKLQSAEGQLLPLSTFLSCCRSGDPLVEWMYIEDEHFVRCHPDLLDDIGECVYTDEDWFQLLPADLRPWNAMLLWGTPGSRSSLHVDLYNWTGTLAVLRGRKRWKIFLPGQDRLLQLTARRSGFPLDVFSYVSPIDAFDPASEEWQAALAHAEYIEFDQSAGELLIIPSGWPHQAYNVEETIALSGQVMNKNNYMAVLEEIFKSGHLQRDRLPCDFFRLPPKEQVSRLAAQLQRPAAESHDYCHPL